MGRKGQAGVSGLAASFPGPGGQPCQSSGMAGGHRALGSWLWGSEAWGPPFFRSPFCLGSAAPPGAGRCAGSARVHSWARDLVPTAVEDCRSWLSCGVRGGWAAAVVGRGGACLSHSCVGCWGPQGPRPEGRQTPRAATGGGQGSAPGKCPAHSPPAGAALGGARRRRGFFHGDGGVCLRQGDWCWEPGGHASADGPSGVSRL